MKSLFFKNKNAPQASVLVKEETAQNLSEAAIIEKIITVCERAAAGDLEARITELNTHPAYARLSRSINAMLDMADSFVRETAAAMQHCSNAQFHRPILLRGLKGAYRHSSVVINKAGVSMKNSHESLALVGKLAEENTESVNTIAAACEELHATSGEITGQTNDASKIIKGAITHGEETRKVVSALTDAFKEIEGVVNVIQSVAQKTNLLALNASIEASRAGQQGTRFAVVASEIKELSQSTAAATETIKKHIASMNASVHEVSNQIASLNKEVESIDTSVTVVKLTMDEQVSATNEISNKMTHILHNTKQVSDRIAK